MATPPPVAEHKRPPPAKAAAGESARARLDAGEAANTGGGITTSRQRFDRMAVRAKLAVSQPGDAVEREADAVADRVMRMPDGSDRGPPAPAARRSGAALPGAVKRAPAPAQQGRPPADTVHGAPVRPATAGPEQAEETPIQREAAPEAQPHQDMLDAAALSARLGVGEPLDADLRAYFEPRLGCDLAHVRIHVDAAADEAARRLGARAFTFGNHIAFAAGQYRPDSAAGRRLIAHELAHVLQQRDEVTPRQIMRDAAGGADEFRIEKNALQIPPIKARHSGAYAELANKGQLRRKGAYDAATRGTRQVAIWLSAARPELGRIPAERRPGAAAGWNLHLERAGGAAAKVVPAASEAELLRLLQIPTWNAKGEDVQYQVDHMVEFQLGGADAIENMELLDQAHNGSVGSSFAHAIKRVISAEIRDDPGNAALTGLGHAPSAAAVMEARTVVFTKVEGRARESNRKEGGSSFWSLNQINELAHVLPMLGGGGDLTGDARNFALLSPTGNLLIARFPHAEGQTEIAVAEAQRGGIAGFRIARLVLNPGYNDAAAGANIGRLEGRLDFGPSVAIPADPVSVAISQVGQPGRYAGRLGSHAGDGMPARVEFKPMSPLDLADITFGNAINGRAMLHPGHPALSGLAIPVDICAGRVGLSYSIDAAAMAERLRIPGVRIDSASIDLGYDGETFSFGGGAEFTIQRFGTGYLDARLDAAGRFSLEGGLRADTRLFDQADMRLWYRSQGGFGGSGVLAITQPGRIKGIKSARIEARYADSVFTATGGVVPDVPGLKQATLEVRYAEDALKIAGRATLDERVPGVRSADIDVTVAQVGEGWKVAAGGRVTPALPGLSGAQLEFSYDDGLVLMQAEFDIRKGPLTGRVTAGVTNAAVDLQGGRAQSGSGNRFSVFGAAEVDMVLIENRLAGKLKLRLLPDGSLRVGGELRPGDFEVFGRHPSDDDKSRLLSIEIDTPMVPLPGLGFSVGRVAVGVNFSATGSGSLFAYIGPGRLTGITIGIDEFDPARVDPETIRVTGSGNFVVHGNAGLSLSARVNVILAAAVAQLRGSIGVTATAGLPAGQPFISARPTFSYSRAEGLEIGGTLNLHATPEVRFALIGEVAAELNLVCSTVTLWRKDWTLAEAAYKLPLGIDATGALSYSSRTNRFRPDNLADAIRINPPKLDAETLTGVLSGDSAPPTIRHVAAEGAAGEGEGGMCMAADEPLYSVDTATSTSAPNQSVMPKASGDAQGRAARTADPNLVARLGSGRALDAATRGYFEQRMRVDLTRVRLHTGPRAAHEAARLRARAFTLGEHIVFGEGEYQPHTPAGRELIAHELAHVAQQQGDGDIVIGRWPAVERTPARTAETPASIRAMTLADFVNLTRIQLDWATSPDLQADAGALAQFRSLQDYAEGPKIEESCGSLQVGAILAQGVPGVYAQLDKYRDGVTSGATAWLRRTDDAAKAVRWGRALGNLEAAWPAANLSLVMRAPDPVGTPSPFEKLTEPATPELPNFIAYLRACTPVLSAGNGKEVDSFLALRAEGAMPASYLGAVRHVRTYHHFTKATLDGLRLNEAFPLAAQRHVLTRRPLTVVLYPAIDHNGAFHRNAGLERLVADTAILTIVVEGLASVGDYRASLAPVAARYGVAGRIEQAMVAGHGNATVLQLAGTADARVHAESLGTRGAAGAATTDLMTELTRLMSADPTRRRIVLDACLTGSHRVDAALRAPPEEAAADVQAAIAANPNLRDFVASIAGPGAPVFGANASFAPAATSFQVGGSSQLDLSVPTDPALVGSKLEYVEFGTEPLGCMRAVLECWAADRLAGTHACRDAVARRLAAGRSTRAVTTASWFESIIQACYRLAHDHYWDNGEALRRMAVLAGGVAELYWPHHTSAAALAGQLAVLGDPAHVGVLLGRLAAESHYAATPRVAVVIEQAWMRVDPARRPQFMTALGRYASAMQAAADVDMRLVLPHVPALLTLPPPVPPPATQLRVALMAVHHAPLSTPPPAVVPEHVEYLRALLGNGHRFPTVMGIDAALGGLTSERAILAAIGRPLAGPRQRAAGEPPPPPPAANVDTTRDAAMLNDFRVEPLRAEGEVATVRHHLMVRSTPTTATVANIFARLPSGTRVRIIGHHRDWYAIEQPGRTGFVAARYIRLLP